MLRGLADAGADVVMHGLVSAEDAKAKTADIAKEFGVQCRHSAADVTKPAEIRCMILSCGSCCSPGNVQFMGSDPLTAHAKTSFSRSMPVEQACQFPHCRCGEFIKAHKEGLAGQCVKQCEQPPCSYRPDIFISPAHAGT